MAAIQLPDLVQRIRVKTDEIRKADKVLDKFGTRVDDVREKASDASDALDELTDSTDRYNESATRTENNASGVIRAIRILDDAADSTSGSIRRTAQSTGGLTGEVNTASTAVHVLGDETDRTNVSIGSLGTSMALSKKQVSSVYTEMDRLRSTVKDVRVETDKTRDSQSKFGSGMDRNGNSVGAFVKKTLAAVGVLGLLRLGLLAVVGAVIIDGLAQIASLLISLAGGAIALTAALAPAAGALAAIPAGILAIQSSIGIFKVITSGAQDAVKAMMEYGPASKEAAEALAGLKGETRDFAEATGQMIFVLNDVRNAVRRAALPLFSEALLGLRPLVASTTDELTGLGITLGSLAQQGAALVSSGPFSRDIQLVLKRNNELVQTLGKAGLFLVNVLRNLVVAAGPMTQTFADLALRGARFLNTVVAAGRQTGDLQRFFRSTVDVIRSLISILFDLGVGLFNVFSLGSKLGDDLLQSIRRGANEFRKWTESARGRNAILEFFRNARPVITQSAKLIGALALTFARLNRETARTTVAPLLRQLRTELLPVLEELLLTLSQSGLISAVGDLATAFVDLINKLPFNPFVEIIKGIASLVQWIVKAIETVPGLGTAIASLALVFGSFKIASFVLSMFGLGKAVSFVSGLISTVLIGALRALAVALLTTPVGWFIVLFTGAMIGLKLLYDRVEWFRNFWDDAWERVKNILSTVIDFVRNNWQTLLVLIGGPIGALVLLIIKNFNTIKNVVISVWGVIGPVISNAVKTWWAIISTVLPIIWNIVKTVFTGIWRTITTVLTVVGGVIKLWWNTYGKSIWVVLQYIWKQIVFVWNIIKGVIGTVLKVIGGLIKFWWDKYGENLFNTLKSMFLMARDFWWMIFNAIKTVVEFLLPFIRAAFALLQKYVIEPIIAIVNFVRRAWDVFYDVVVTKVIAVYEKIRSIWDRVYAIFSGVVSTLYNIGRDIIQGLIDGVTSMFGPIKDAFNWITDHIPDWKGPIDKDRRLLYDQGRAVMEGFEMGLRDRFRSVEDALGEMTKKVGAAFANTETGTPGNEPDKQLRTTNVAARVQRKLMEDARKAAIKENRLRAKLPLLEGAERKKAIEQIKQLQAEQLKAVRQSQGVRAVADLRKDRQEALKNANRAAVKAQELRSKLPGLEGAERRKAVQEIKRLEEERKDELKKAKDVQTELIKTFRDLPAGIRKLLNEARRDRDEKIEKQREKERREDRDRRSGGGTGGFSTGQPNDPVYSRLTRDSITGMAQAEDHSWVPKSFWDDTKGTRKHTKDTVSNTKETKEVIDKMGRRLNPLPESMDSVDANLIELRRDQRDTRVEFRLGLAANAQNIRAKIAEAKAEAAADAKQGRDNDDHHAKLSLKQNTNLAAQNRQRLSQIKDGIATAGHADAFHIIDAIRQTRTTPPEVRPDFSGTKGTGKERGSDSPRTPGKVVNNHVTVNNPTGEPTEESVTKRLRHLEVTRPHG